MNYQKINLIGGAEVNVDMDCNRTKCRKCQKFIRFGITKNGKSMPIIEVIDKLTGETKWQSHFSDCVYADHFRNDRLSQIEEGEKNQQELSNW
jgi:hypothetical protein